jgi:hypothetical protein
LLLHQHESRPVDLLKDRFNKTKYKKYTIVDHLVAMRLKIFRKNDKFYKNHTYVKY